MWACQCGRRNNPPTMRTCVGCGTVRLAPAAGRPAELGRGEPARRPALSTKSSAPGPPPRHVPAEGRLAQLARAELTRSTALIFKAGFATRSTTPSSSSVRPPPASRMPPERNRGGISPAPSSSASAESPRLPHGWTVSRERSRSRDGVQRQGAAGAAEALRIELLRDAIREVYAEHNPAQLVHFEQLQRKYAGKEEQWYRAVCGKHGATLDEDLLTGATDFHVRVRPVLPRPLHRTATHD